jgi:expansin (peptidoglycan-binding protein)
MYMNANCNQCVQVNYNGKSIIVTATDTCPGCGDTGIDLSQDGFTELAGSTDAGRIDVTWQIVPCA